MIVRGTHAFYWSMSDPDRLSEAARAAIESSTMTILSAASLYEIAYKVGSGNWPDAAGLLEKDLIAELGDTVAGLVLLPVSVEAMLLAGQLDRRHRDPFDRMIAATAITENAAVISNDVKLDLLAPDDLRRIW